MKQHSKLAIIGLILGIVAICCFLLSLILFMGYYYSISPILFMLISIILSILAIIFGATSYWGKWKDKLGLTDFIVGFIVVIIWFVTWIILFVYATGMLYGVPGYRPKVK